MSKNPFKLTKKNNPIIGNNKNKNSALSEINSGNRLITTNSIFLGKIDKKMNELKKDKQFMEKKISRKILLFYDKFKISLESSNYTVPIWQYKFLILF